MMTFTTVMEYARIQVFVLILFDTNSFIGQKIILKFPTHMWNKSKKGKSMENKYQLGIISMMGPANVQLPINVEKDALIAEVLANYPLVINKNTILSIEI